MWKMRPLLIPGKALDMLPGWYYWLGLWAIGAFADEASCDNARRYQIEAGASVQHQVSICQRVNEHGPKAAQGTFSQGDN